jgi:DNA-binding transcriptional MerR regulator
MTNPLLPLMDLKAAASMCHVSPHTVRKWVKLGRLIPIRICRRLLFHPNELERFINQGHKCLRKPEAALEGKRW